MASALQNLSEYDDTNLPDMTKFRIGIVVADWNKDITHRLYEGCYDTLIRHGADAERIFTAQVPGAYELPTAAKLLSDHRHCDAVICLGCVIKGETDHDVYINQAVAQGLMNLGVLSGKPFVFGLLTPNTHAQAADRAGGAHGNKGVEAAVTAMRMLGVKEELKRSGGPKIGF